ncbi:MAG: hypothetical protein ABI277_13625 [Burkholderiaceae bacterium]
MPIASVRAVARRVLQSTSLTLLVVVAGCYPRYDWRDHRPDCARSWCGFVASFPGRVTNASREIPVGTMRLPLALNVVSVGDVTFAIGAFDLLPGSDPEAARAVFERKLLDDVGATEGRRGEIVLHATDRQPLVATTFEADGKHDGKALHATARFVQRQGRLIEILVIGPADVLATGSGRQAVETFVTSLRLD